jgi:hypothetical protein
MGYFLPEEATLPADTELASQAYERAKEAFQALEFESVRENARTAIRLYKAQIESSGSHEGYVETLHLLAATELFDNQQAAATRAMADAVVFDRRPPSKKLFNPAVQQLHQKVLVAKDRGAVMLRARPGALIWFNGRLRGFASGKITRRPGLYWVRISRPGHAPWLEWVRVHSGQTQTLTTTLRPMEGAESESMRLLREATSQPTPPPELAATAREAGAQQILLVSALAPCEAARCRILINWAAERRWLRRGEALFAGDPAATASQLLGARAPTPSMAGAMGRQPIAVERSCRSDSDCVHGQECEEGRCQRTSSVASKWWFWTIVGVVAAGAAAGVAVPLLLPDAPVIEVK